MARTTILLTSALMISACVASAQEEQDVYTELERFGDVFSIIEREYVEEVDPADLINAAIDGMLQSLDPHSSYVSEEDFVELQEDTSGEFGGLGIQVEMDQDKGAIKVISPFDGTPADAAGIQSGDYITHVDGESLLGLSLQQSVEKLRGPVGSTITITIFREGMDEPFDVEITRDSIASPSSLSRVYGDAVYVRISQFNEQTIPSMTEGIEASLEEIGGIDNVEGFVLDLRRNPGGLLTTAIEVTDAFLDQGEIVSTRGRDAADSGRANATKGDIAKGKPIVVLIDNGSASASEIVAGALQDHHRAIIVGEPSFGKGSVQSILPISENSAIRLTTSRYYTPSGRSIQGLGVDPDVYVEQPLRAPEETDEERSQAFDRFDEGDLRGALDNDSLSEEEIQELEAERAEREEQAKLRDEDYQLAYALDILHGLSVYGDK